ncbi:NAD-binding protein [bacterium SCSIO 12696]|nr:NAD-binding protein [bacterium SCSIO 12696]
MQDSRSLIFSRVERTAIGIGMALAMVLAILGFTQHYQTTSQPASFLDILYNAIGVFFLQVSIEPGDIPVALEIARWLAPACLSYTAFKTFTTVMSNRLLQRRISHLSGHAIICGLDSVSTRALDTLLTEGITTVVIEANNQNKYIGQTRKKGAFILVGNPADLALLKQANMRNAMCLLAVTEDDHINLETAYHCFQQRQSDAALPPISCAVRISNREITQVLYQQPLFATDQPNFSSRIIDYEQLAARWLLGEYGPDKILGNKLNTHGTLTIALIGESALIEELIIRLACIGHYGQSQPLQICVISAHASKNVNALICAQPALDSILRISAHDTQISVLNASYCQQVFNGIQPDIAYLHTDNTEQALSWAQVLMNLELAFPVVTCESGDGFFPDMLERQLKDSSHFACVKVMEESCHFDNIINTHQDHLAMAIHKNYRDSQLEVNDTLATNASLVDWQQLPETLKDANRNQADHLHIKCRKIFGEDSYTAEAISALLTDDNIEILAMMEHDRWRAEKELNGWRYHHGGKNNNKRLSPNLVPWQDLSELEKEKDRDSVRHLPKLLTLLEKTQSSS